MKIDLDPHTFLFSFLKVSVLCLVSASAHWISQKKQLRPSAADQTSDTGDNMMEIFFLVQLNEYFLYFQQVDALMRTSCVLRDWNLKVSLLNCQYLRDPASTPSRRAAVFIVLSFMRCWLPCSKTPLCHTAPADWVRCLLTAFNRNKFLRKILCRDPQHLMVEFYGGPDLSPSQLEQVAGMVTPWASSRSPEPRGAGMDPAAEETRLQTALSLFMRSESSGVKLWTRDASWRPWNIQAHSKHSQDGAGEKEENMRWREGWTEEPVCYLQDQRWGSWKFLSEQQQPVNRSSSVSAGVHDDSPHTPPDHQMVLSKNVWPQTKRNPETFPAVCRRGTIQDENSKLLLCMILSIWLLKIHWPVLNLKVRCLDFGADRKTDEESLCLFFRGRHFF